MKVKITKILEKHLEEAHKLYNYYIVNSYANLEETEVSFKDFHKNYKNITDNKLPYLVAINDKKVIGIAYLNKFRDKSGYRFSFENTIYVSNQNLKVGIGSKLMEKLIDVSKNNKNIKKIVAVISVIDNRSSIKIHRKFGFKKTGELKNIGFKNNKWINVILMQKSI